MRFEVDFFRFFVDFGPFWDSDLEAFWDKSHEKMRLEKMMKKRSGKRSATNLKVGVWVP